MPITQRQLPPYSRRQGNPVLVVTIAGAGHRDFDQGEALEGGASAAAEWFKKHL